MFIYHLEREQDVRRWDVADGFVVVAESEHRARNYASDNAGDEGAEVWQRGSTICRKLGCVTADVSDFVKEGVVLQDFCNG